MKEIQVEPAAPGLQLNDIYYTLFRHKWKILGCTLAGFVAAAGLYLLNKPMYQSEAKLFVRYVIESKSFSPNPLDPQVKSPDSRGDNIINSELEILTSLDIAQQVAEAIGPQKILAMSGGGSNVTDAAIVIQKNLDATVPKKSSIIDVTFKHSDPTLVQPVLRAVVESYFRKHTQIHRGAGIFDEFLSQQTDQLRSRLAQTEQDLRKIKGKAGVFSLDDAKKAFNDQISKITQDQWAAEAELAERIAALKEMQKVLPKKPEATASEAGLPVETIATYKRLCERVEQLAKREQELLLQFTEANTLVKDIRSQLATAEKQKKEAEEANPKLTSVSIAPTKDIEKLPDIATEVARIAALEAKINTLKQQLQKVHADGSALQDSEATIVELQRKKDLEDTQYRYFSASLEQARIDETLGAGKISNITEAQAPSPAARAPSKILKFMGGAIASGVALGLGLAFSIDLYLDETVKRSTDLETRLRLPVFFNIPYRNGRARFVKVARAPKPVPDVSGNGAELAPATPAIAPWDQHHSLHDYWESLRDRLVTYFEVRNLTHKPKLVAITGCGRGSGISTIATGLAASLSETGDGNVLLVDMNEANGTAHPFYQGKPGCGLSDVLEAGKRDSALVQTNLYMATANSACAALQGILPRRFNSLMPKLKASDYDYIIFDMPSITPTSITPRLANFMDVVLLVVEAERTNQQVAKRASALLGESGGNVQTILNKSRNYLPAGLQHDI